MTRKARRYLNYDDPVVPMHQPRLLVEVAVEQGADAKALLEGTGINTAMFESPDARISLRQYARLARNAIRHTGNPGLGLDFGSRVQLPNFGMVGLAAMSSRDARTAIDLALQYYRLLMPAWDLSLEVKGDRASLVVREAIPFQEHRVFATEFLLSAIDNLARSLLGREVLYIEIRLNFPRPDHAERYAEFTRAPILFDQPVTEVIVDAAVLQQKLPSSDPITVRAAERQCAAALASTGSSEGLVAAVRRILGASPGEYPDPEQLAGALQTSERTLRRSLKEMGSSYQSMLDQARREHAIQLLTGTAMSVNEIGEKLGFSEGRAFRRAFKRWTSRTPTQFRRQKM